jgi:hypothetical protein
MPIEYLIILSYGYAILFLMTLISGIGAVIVLRRTRLDKLEVAAASNPEALRQKLYMIYSPLDDVQTWNSKATQIAAKVSDIPQTLTALPMRYQQTLIYRENKSNPQNEVETKPLVIP